MSPGSTLLTIVLSGGSIAGSILCIYILVRRVYDRYYNKSDALETMQEQSYQQQVHIHVHVPSTGQSIPHGVLVSPAVAGQVPSAPPLSPTPYSVPPFYQEDDCAATDYAFGRELQDREVELSRHGY